MGAGAWGTDMACNGNFRDFVRIRGNDMRTRLNIGTVEIPVLQKIINECIPDEIAVTNLDSGTKVYGYNDAPTLGFFYRAWNNVCYFFQDTILGLFFRRKIEFLEYGSPPIILITDSISSSQFKKILSMVGDINKMTISWDDKDSATTDLLILSADNSASGSLEIVGRICGPVIWE